MSKITPCLWFDTEAEEAANFYISLFPNSRIGAISRYPEFIPGRAGSVLTVTFELDGRQFMGLNGGPRSAAFNDAVSFSVDCHDQSEVDHYWDKLSEGGETGRCSWLKDRYGVSWQIVPSIMPELLTGPDPERAARAMQAMMEMTKLDIAALKAAADG